jgi:class 3 adenylate cyclase
LAARLKKTAAKLERIIVTSEVFASHCESQLIPLGEFTVRGFGAPQTVFEITDEGK